MIKILIFKAKNFWEYNATSIQRAILTFFRVLISMVAAIGFIFWVITWTPILIGIFVIIFMSLLITLTIRSDSWL